MRRFVLPILLLILASPDVPASFIVRLDGQGVGTVGTVIYDDGLGHRGSAHTFIGQLHMTFDLGGVNHAFNTFSIDLFHRQVNGQRYQVNIRDLGKPPTFSDWMYGSEMAFLYGKYGAANLDNSIDAAALQLAIWKLSLGSTGTLLMPGMSQSIVSRQQAFLTEAALYPKYLATGRWLDASPAGNHFGRGQSVILEANGVLPPMEAPAPGGLALAGSGAAFGIIGLFRRFRLTGRAINWRNNLARRAQ